MYSQRNRRIGFTPVEFVACATLVTLLAAIGAPAVMREQLFAKTMQCRNNLKQLGLSLHNYHSTYNTFPPGWISRDMDAVNVQGIAWGMMLTPYLDQANVFNQAQPNGGELDELSDSQRTAFRTRLKTFRCPNDDSPPFNPIRGDWPTSNYPGNFGHHPFPRWMAAPGGLTWPGQIASPSQRDPLHRATGIFFVNSKIGFRDVIDGSSNTLIVGERAMRTGAAIWGGVTSNAHEQDALIDGSHQSRPNASLGAYSSQHLGGGFHGLMVDGSIHSFSDQIDSQRLTDPKASPTGVLQKISARNDRQIVEF